MLSSEHGVLKWMEWRERTRGRLAHAAGVRENLHAAAKGGHSRWLLQSPYWEAGTHRHSIVASHSLPREQREHGVGERSGAETQIKWLKAEKTISFT